MWQLLSIDCARIPSVSLGTEPALSVLRRINRLDAAFPRQAAFEPIDFISFFAGSALFCMAKDGNIRGTNAWWILEKKSPSAPALASLERLGTVIGNLREVAERLAPGRACISVVSDHGFVKTGAPLHLFPAFRKARPPSSGSFEVAAARSPGVLDFSSKRCSMAASVVRNFILLSTIMLLASTPAARQQAGLRSTTEGDFVVKLGKFRSGETLPELHFHHATLAKPVRDADARVTNAALILHGTG